MLFIPHIRLSTTWHVAPTSSVKICTLYAILRANLMAARSVQRSHCLQCSQALIRQRHQSITDNSKSNEATLTAANAHSSKLRNRPAVCTEWPRLDSHRRERRELVNHTNNKAALRTLCSSNLPSDPRLGPGAMLTVRSVSSLTQGQRIPRPLDPPAIPPPRR